MGDKKLIETLDDEELIALDRANIEPSLKTLLWGHAPFSGKELRGLMRYNFRDYIEDSGLLAFFPDTPDETIHGFKTVPQGYQIEGILAVKLVIGNPGLAFGYFPGYVAYDGQQCPDMNPELRFFSESQAINAKNGLDYQLGLHLPLEEISYNIRRVDGSSQIEVDFRVMPTELEILGLKRFLAENIVEPDYLVKCLQEKNVD